ncbi:MAG: aminoglycoside phosphotransferase family protein [Actinocatenispora sp.]
MAEPGTVQGDPRWSPVSKLDAEWLVGQVRAATGVALRYEGPCPGGAVGAGYVRWPDGRPAVLTVMPGVDRQRVDAIRDMLALARAHDVPVPEYQLVVEVPGALAVLQERLPGAITEELDCPLADRMVALNERFRGVLAGTDHAHAELFLDRSGPGFCLHEPLAGYDARTARVLDRILEIGRAVPPRMTGDDLVHTDFHQQNVLVDADRAITGVIDWDGAYRGDRRFALVVLRFAVSPGDTVLAGHLDGLLADRLSPDELRPYWAHMSLRMVDWSIRHLTADHVTHYVELADRMPS